MEDLSKSSFIPKRGPASTQKHGGPTRHVYVFTLISYTLMFATLLAAGGVYFYSKHVDGQLANEVVALNSEISSFSKADMKKIIDFDSRLVQASDRLNNNVSLVSILESLEAATINTVKIISLEMTREDDDKFLLAASIETNSFDSTIFQRGVYERNQAIDSVIISDLATVEVNDAEEVSSNILGPKETIVKFVAELEVPLSAVPYVPVREVVDLPITISEPVEELAQEPILEPATEAEELDSNEENI